jgi:hypothetical protein
VLHVSLVATNRRAGSAYNAIGEAHISRMVLCFFSDFVMVDLYRRCSISLYFLSEANTSDCKELLRKGTLRRPQTPFAWLCAMSLCASLCDHNVSPQLMRLKI